MWQSPKLKTALRDRAALSDPGATINARGIRCDRAFVTAARDLAIRERTAINLKLQELTHGAITSVDQTKRFLAAINARGHAMTSLNKRAVAQVLAHKPDDYVRQLLELRRTGARAAVNKFKRMLAYASPADDRMRGTLRMYGARARALGRARTAAAEPEEEREQSAAVGGRFRSQPATAPASPNTAIRWRCSATSRAPRSAPAQAWSSSPATSPRSKAWCWPGSPANTGSSIAYQTYQQTGDTTLEPYRVIARKMLHKPADAEINTAERQLGKGAELASGFGGSVGAWRRIVPHDPRTRRRDQGDHPAMARRASGHAQVLEGSRPRHPRRDPHRPADPGRATAATADRRRRSPTAISR